MKKKNKMIIIIALVCLILIGCQKNKETNKHLKISLYSNPSTGYRWTYNIDKQDIIDISKKYDNSNCSPKAEGCGGKEIYTIKGLKPGKVTLTLIYSFIEKDKYPSKTATYEITVNDDLSITETHDGSYFKKDE